MPSFVNPKKNTKSSTVSGMLRRPSTQTVPAHRRGGTGLIRNVAITMPRTNARTKASSVMEMVPLNPST